MTTSKRGRKPNRARCGTPIPIYSNWPAVEDRDAGLTCALQPGHINHHKAKGKCQDYVWPPRVQNGLAEADSAAMQAELHGEPQGL